MKKLFGIFCIITLMFSFILVGFSKSTEFDLIPSFKVSNEKYFVIEFSDFIFEDDKNNLKSNGVNIISYIGNNSFLTKFDKNMINNIANLLFVKSVYRYKKPKSETKFNSINSITNRNKFIQRSVSKSEEKKMFEINLFDESISNEFKDEVLKLGGSIHSGDLERFNVFIEESKLDSLLQYEEVNYISEFSFNEILNSNSKGYTKVYDYFNKYNLYGEGQIIGIADTGFDIGVVSSSLHKDFLNKSISISTFTQSGLTDDGPSDKSTGHGTHVAGSVLGTGFLSGANLSTNTYINSNSGMAPKSDLFFQAMELKCDNSGICGSSLNKFVLVTPDNLATGMFQPAYDYGVRIHTNSWGDNTKKGVYSRDSFDADTFIWNNKDFTILFAAGNSGSSTKTVLSPSTSKNAITVGATSRDSSVVFFSSRGPTNDGRIKPDVVAPGTGIISTRSQVSTSGSGDYTFKQGTSMATPIVAGITSLVREYLIKNKEFINPSSALIKAMLINGARDVTGTVPDMNQGWGFVDLNRTLYESVSVSNQFFDIKSGLSTSQSFEYNFSFPRNSDELRITLVWSDYPGTPTGDGKELVNDLNLILITPNGTQYNGNDFTSPFNSSIDNVNNVEGIRIKDMMYGDYTLRVEGFNIPEDVQPFSFVISSGELIDFISVENLDSLKIFDKPYIEFNVSTTRNANKGWLSFDNENMNLSLDMINSTNFNSSFRFLDSGNYSFVVYMNDSISGEIFESYKREFIITNPEINFIKPNFNSTLKSLNYEVNFLLNFSKNISEIFYFNQTSYINLTDKLDNNTLNVTLNMSKCGFQSILFNVTDIYGVKSFKIINFTFLILPKLIINSPLNNTNINVSKLSFPINFTFNANISKLTYSVDSYEFDITGLINNSKKELVTQIQIFNYSNQVFTFNYTSGIDNSEIYKLYLNFTLNLGGNESDFDNDGILDLLDTIIGNSDNIETSFSSLVMSVNSSTNLSVIYSDVLNVSFSDNSEKIFEFEHNFSESSIYLTSLTVKSETINNKSKLFLNGLILSGNKTKTVYLKLSGNYSKFYSLCLKDSKVISFDEISELCDGLNETFINSIPSSLNGYDISFTNSSNSTIKVSGLKHSGLSQMCTEKWIYSSSFSVCVSNSQFKIPFDENLCGTEHTKPSILTQSCGFIQTDDDNSGGGRSSYNYYENNVELNIENESSIETDNISNELNLSYNESSNFSNINNNNSEFLHTNDTLSFNGNIVNSDMNNKNKLVQSDNKQYQVYILAFLFFISFIIILKIILLKHKVVLIKEEKHKLKK